MIIRNHYPYAVTLTVELDGHPPMPIRIGPGAGLRVDAYLNGLVAMQADGETDE